MNIMVEKPPVLHILVVGFHHKLGCQVEFSYPPLIAGTTGKNECPSGWKYLPTLALPDGSHNFLEDTVFFNLPSLMDPTESVYGVSCYRQVAVEKLKIRTADVTRSTVQKSVCILARLPIYGYIEVKLSLIADAFFDQGDFSCTELLVKAYQQLNCCLVDDEASRRPLHHFYVGLSLREILLQWRHKALIFFKLLLLQRRVVCFASPVYAMCGFILSVASLMPRLLEKGFQEVACVRTSRPLSPMPDFTATIKRECADALPSPIDEPNQHPVAGVMQSMAALVINPHPMTDESVDRDQVMHLERESPDGETTNDALLLDAKAQMRSTRTLQRFDSNEGSNDAGSNNKRTERSNSLTRESSIDTLASTLSILSSVSPDEYRAPIAIFASGNLCLPYLSLPYMDLLTDPSVLSYVIGTSNVLFQQKRQLADVLVDIENASFDVHDAELRRQLLLSTEDLRFIDYLTRHAQMPKEDGEGSEHWIREQFQGYLLALLRTAAADDATLKDCDHFNTHFMAAFKRTQCFQEWYDVRPGSEFFEDLPAGHPFAGTLSVTDMKLKIAQTMQNSESGRKINQAVNTTSRAVGGAISQAKGAFSNWWSSITTPVVTATATSTANSTTNTIGENNDGVPTAAARTLSNTFPDNNEGGDYHINTTKDSDASKLIDSAEELQENGIATTVAVTSATDTALSIDYKGEPCEEKALTAAMANESNNLADMATAPSSGIVEIGREAEMLNNSLALMANTSAGTFCLGDAVDLPPAASSSNISERSNGNVFIV